jgi:hypothetical protein
MHANPVINKLSNCREGQLGSDSRIEQRVVVNIAGKMKSLDPVTSTGPSHPVTVVEISQRGLGVQADREYLPGSSVQVLVLKEAFVGKVLRCFRSGPEFTIAIQLRDGILDESECQ